MTVSRRVFTKWLGYSATNFGLATLNSTSIAQDRTENMYGLIGKIIALEDKADELAEILIGGISNMPGCMSYIVAKDSIEANSLWITEVWEDQDKHTASLELPSVVDAIGKGRPLIAGFGERFETQPLGGQGIL